MPQLSFMILQRLFVISLKKNEGQITEQRHGLRLRMLPSHYWKFEETSCYCTLGNQFLPSRVSSRLQTADDCKMNLYDVSQLNRILYLVDISEKSYTLKIYNMYTIYLILLEKMLPFFPLF